MLTELGHDVIPVTKSPLNDPHFIDSFLVYWAKGASDIADLVRSRTGRPAEETGLLEPWTLGLAAHFRARPETTLNDALENFRKVQHEVAEFFEEFDAWLSPVTATPAPPIGHQAPTLDFETLLERVSYFAAYTPIHNTAGTPAMSVPFAWSGKGLPIGVQISSKLGNEGLLFKLAYQIEEAQPWAQRLPPIVA